LRHGTASIVREAHPGGRDVTRGIFVTGTDTGVGKTFAAVALLRSLGVTGVRAVGMKPVAAGIDPGAAMNADVAALVAAANVAAPQAAVNPYSFPPPIAPHLAARMAGVDLDLGLIAAAYARLAASADVVVVEGAGGVLVPLGARTDMLDIAERLGLPVLLVVGIRLGCLNHALLSALAITARGLHLVGWVANRIDPAMAEIDGNLDALRGRLPAPLVADFGWCDQGVRPAAFDAAALRVLGLAGDATAGGDSAKLAAGRGRLPLP
jgi:dethiobiotin synthetase